MQRRLFFFAFTLLVLASLGILALLFRPSDLGRVAYVQAGDIWIRDLPDGKPLRLTTDGRNSTPKFSASGQWLAFRKDDNRLRTMRTNEQSAAFIHPEPVSRFSWAPDADRLAIVANGALSVLEAGQTTPRLIVPNSPREHTGVHDFLWSPDGKWIVCEYEEKRDVSRDEWPWRTSIRKVNVERAESEEIISFPPPDEEGFPGNIALAAWAGPRTYLWQCEVMSASIMADGCPLFYLDPDKAQKEVDVTTLLYPDFLSFSPDGKELAITKGHDRLTWTNKCIELINLETRQHKTLTRPDTAAFSPAWSPDGSQIAYVSALEISADIIDEDRIRNAVLERRIRIMKMDGSEKRRLTHDDGYREEQPRWLADGRYIIFLRMDIQERISLWLARTDGTAIQRIAEGLSPYTSGSGEGYLYYGHVRSEVLFDIWPKAPLAPNSRP